MKGLEEKTVVFFSSFYFWLWLAGVLFAVFLYKMIRVEISLLGQARIQVLSNYIIMTGKRLWSALGHLQSHNRACAGKTR